MYELIENGTGNSYGIFKTYDEAYQEKININHRVHMVSGGDYYVDLKIVKVDK